MCTIKTKIKDGLHRQHFAASLTRSDKIIFHTQPSGTETAGGGELAEVAAEGVLPGEADQILSDTGERVRRLETQESSWSFIEEFTKGLRPEERRLFIDTYVDRMTGLLNRSGLNLYNRMLKEGRRVSIAMLDGDHFGALNTVCGKSFADNCISTIGDHLARLTEELRTTWGDVYVVRWGGEEFIIFGDMPKEDLAQAIETVCATIKSELRGRISEEDVRLIAHQIFDTKYSCPDGLALAEREIGGITSGVSSFQFNQQPQIPARETITMIDMILGKGKNVTGRGKTYIDPRDTKTASEEAITYQDENDLTPEQNEKLYDVKDRLKETVNKQFEARTPLATDLLRKFGDNPEIGSLLQTFLIIPPSTMQNAGIIAAKTGVSEGELRLAKIEIMHAHHDYGTYTGAATMQKINSLGDDYTHPREIAVGEFKSINETLGHTHGDTFLMWFYQDVIKEAAQFCNLNEDDIIIAQHRANFVYRLKREKAESSSQFEAQLIETFQRKLRQLTREIDSSDPDFLDRVRTEWMRTDKKATFDESIKNMHKLFITDHI